MFHRSGAHGPLLHANFALLRAIPALLALLSGLLARPSGAATIDPGGEVRLNIGSFRAWTFYDAREDDSEFLLQRSRLNLRAEVNEHLSGMLEVQAFGDWGRNEADLGIWWPDRRDDHVADEDIWLYQGYLSAGKPWGKPVAVQLGRQELTYGREFLLGNNDTGDMFFGHSFDAVKGNASLGDLNLDLFMARLADHRFLLDVGEDVTAQHYQITDDNATLYGGYATWGGWAERFGLRALDGYLLSIQIGDYNEALAGELLGLDGPLPAAFPGHVNMDGRHQWLGTFGGWFPAGRWDTNPSGWWAGRNAGDGTNPASVLNGADTLAADAALSTAGFRLEGDIPGSDRPARIDYELEYARQFGRTGRPNFADSSRANGHYDAWAMDLTVGLEMSSWWGRPRLSGGYAHFSGGAGQNRIDESGNRVPDDDVGTFQRLWSDKQYGENLDRAPFGAFLSNVRIVKAAVGVDVTSDASVRLDFFHYTVDEPLDPNGPVFGANPEVPALTPNPIGQAAIEPDDDLGSEVDILGTYFFTDSLRATAGYALFLNGSTIADQAPSEFEAATNQHYVFLDVQFTF